MPLENLHIGLSALTGQVYAGYVNKGGRAWRQKVDVTNDFLAAVIDRWAGYEETITSSSGEAYIVTVRKVDREGKQS